MRYRCTACAMPFELTTDETPRCPKCLRKSTVRDADAQGSTATARPSEARRVLVSVVAAGFVLFALFTSWLALHHLMLLAGSTRVSGEVIDARLTSSSVPTCSVHYRYTIDGVERTAHASVSPPCPHGAIHVRVSSFDADVSDLGESFVGIVELLVAPFVLFVAFAAVVVALQLWMPESERLRRISAALGSRYARRF